MKIMNEERSKQPGWDENKRIRMFGTSGHLLIALHGGPGAIGDAYRIAKGLENDFRVLEPWQRRSGQVSLTVSQHVEDLHQLILTRCENDTPSLIGSSWGAMLALAYAQKYSAYIKSLILVGCGSFDKASRAVIGPIRKKRIEDYINRHPEYEADLDLPFHEQVMKWHTMTDAFEIESDDFDIPGAEPFEEDGFRQSWADMVNCQETGIYPQSFTSIDVPVLMLHGEDDPHPGRMIREVLVKHIPQLEYHEFPKCGHNPEIEKYARADFFRYICDWLNA